jgi:lipoyl(octanoyl) transferase
VGAADTRPEDHANVPAQVRDAVVAAPQRIGSPWRVLTLGVVPYGAALERQMVLVAQRVAQEIPDTLLLLEHPAVVTLGRAKTTANLGLSPAELRQRGIEFFEVTRGGDATYHAPGQLVGYPIFDLTQHGRDVLQFCRRVETALIAVLAAHGIAAGAVPGKAGVWVGDRKIASMGVSLRRWVTFHGFALNVNTDLAGFRVIRPCGEDPSIMTSMAKELGRPVSLPAVCDEVISAFQQAFLFGEPRLMAA